MKRLKERPIKTMFKCNFCNGVSPVSEWHKSTIRKHGGLSRRLPNGRGSTYACPRCHTDVNGSRIQKVIYHKGKEVDGYFIN